MSVIEDANKLIGYIENLVSVGADILVKNPVESPDPSVGMFVKGFLEWEPNKEYKKGDLFSYNGSCGYIKQPSLTSMEIYPPFSTGTEALYGVRPEPDLDGVYPYVYNMGVYEGMLVRGNNGKVYKSKTGTKEKLTEILYAPEDIPALFDLVE